MSIAYPTIDATTALKSAPSQQDAAADARRRDDHLEWVVVYRPPPSAGAPGVEQDVHRAATQAAAERYRERFFGDHRECGDFHVVHRTQYAPPRVTAPAPLGPYDPGYLGAQPWPLDHDHDHDQLTDAAVEPSTPEDPTPPLSGDPPAPPLKKKKPRRPRPSILKRAPR